MSWTYSGDPSTSDRDAVRFLVGDTDEDDQQLSDSEIEYILSENSNDPYGAAVQGAEALAAKYARQMDKRVGQLWIMAEARFEHYRLLAEQLKRNKMTRKPNFVGVMSTNVQDRRSFELGQHDDRFGAGKQFEDAEDGNADS